MQCQYVTQKKKKLVGTIFGGLNVLSPILCNFLKMIHLFLDQESVFEVLFNNGEIKYINFI
jgi:hypothetical protein